MQTIEITTDEQLEEFIESATEASYFATEQSTSLAFVVFCSEDGDWYATRPPHEEDPKTVEGNWSTGVTLSVDSLTLPITVIDPRDAAPERGASLVWGPRSALAALSEHLPEVNR